jgi:hypothetical protein
MHYTIRLNEKIALALLARQAQTTADASLRLEGKRLARLLQKLKTARANRGVIDDRILALEKRIMRRLNHIPPARLPEGDKAQRQFGKRATQHS